MMSQEQAIPRNPPKSKWAQSAAQQQQANDPQDEYQDENVVVIKTTEEKLREAERQIATEIFNLNTVPEDLSNWSGAAAFFQITQALILFFIAMREDDSTTWYWYVHYPNPSLGDENADRIPEAKQVSDFSLLWLIPLVPLLSG